MSDSLNMTGLQRMLLRVIKDSFRVIEDMTSSKGWSLVCWIPIQNPALPCIQHVIQSSPNTARKSIVRAILPILLLQGPSSLAGEVPPKANGYRIGRLVKAQLQ